MNINRYLSDINVRGKSILKKTCIWAGFLYIFYLFYIPKSDYISKQVSDTVVKYFIGVILGLFMCVGFYISFVFFLGNENDIEKMCFFVLENHIAIMLAIILNK